MVVAGPIGSGKTTLSQMIKSDFSDAVKLIWMAVPPGNSIELFLFIAQELGLTPSSSEKVFLLRDIKDALLKINSEGGKCLLIIDESHLMADDALINGIRLLNNLEEGPTKFLHILLLGQEELLETINRPEMEPLRQRIATLEIMGKMKGERIREYVSHRIRVAGGLPSIFSDTGWEALDLAFSSGNTPRVINSLCDRCLNAAFEKGKTAVDIDDVNEIAEGMGLSKAIFHYKIKLKSLERMKQAASLSGNAPVKGPEKPAADTVQPLGRGPGSAGTGHNNKWTEIYQPVRKESATGFSIPVTEKKGLKKPVLVLLVVMGALILSLFSFCQGSGSIDLMTCFLELFGF